MFVPKMVMPEFTTYSPSVWPWVLLILGAVITFVTVGFMFYDMGFDVIGAVVIPIGIVLMVAGGLNAQRGDRVELTNFPAFHASFEAHHPEFRTLAQDTPRVMSDGSFIWYSIYDGYAAGCQYSKYVLVDGQTGGVVQCGTFTSSGAHPPAISRLPRKPHGDAQFFTFDWSNNNDRGSNFDFPGGSTHRFHRAPAPFNR